MEHVHGATHTEPLAVAHDGQLFCAFNCTAVDLCSFASGEYLDTQ